MELFISSACIPESRLASNLARMTELGFRHVELTGGLQHEENVVSAWQEFVTKQDHQLQLHNYAPRPATDFVINLAAADEDTYTRSLEHIHWAAQLSRSIGAKRYAFHAGFYIPIAIDELGKAIRKRSLFDRATSYERFVTTLNALYEQYGDLLYVENNVVSHANFEQYGQDPFMLTHSNAYFELKERVPRLQLLLDVAHLYVSCHTLGLSFAKECSLLADETDYIHISDNDGTADTNLGLKPNSPISVALQQMDVAHKTITLEIYSGIDEVKRSVEMLQALQA